MPVEILVDWGALNRRLFGIGAHGTRYPAKATLRHCWARTIFRPKLQRCSAGPTVPNYCLRA